jgi:hypothetical protein
VSTKSPRTEARGGASAVQTNTEDSKTYRPKRLSCSILLALVYFMEFLWAIHRDKIIVVDRASELLRVKVPE